MDDLAGKLNELLNSPEGMAQVQNLAQMLGQSQQEDGSPAPSSSSGANNGNGASLGALSSLLGGLNNSTPASGGGALPDANTLQMVTRLAPMLSAARQEDDSTRLLRALRPLLGPERQKKLDEAIRLLQIMRMLPMLRQSGLLSSFL